LTLGPICLFRRHRLAGTPVVLTLRGLTLRGLTLRGLTGLGWQFTLVTFVGVMNNLKDIRVRIVSNLGRNRNGRRLGESLR
jgi:hypothetical protein